jgi:hypothetical protein
MFDLSPGQEVVVDGEAEIPKSTAGISEQQKKSSSEKDKTSDKN